MLSSVTGQPHGYQQLNRALHLQGVLPNGDPQDTLVLHPAPPPAPVIAPIQLTHPQLKALRDAYEGLFNTGGPGTAVLLEDNAQSWNARWRMLESAQKVINTQYFCWDRDIFGMAYLGHIYKKIKDGKVTARIMVDATGDTWGTRGFKSHIGGRDYLQELVGTGFAEAKVYHPHYKKIIDQAVHPLSSYIAASNHDKILEVDGERGMTGGRNIGFEYFVDPRDFKGAWRDTDVAFESPAAARALRSAFEVEYGAPWINDTVKPDLLGNWVKRDLELLGAYAMMDIWLKAPPFSENEKKLFRFSEVSRNEAADHLVAQVLARLPAEGMHRAPGRRERKSLVKMARELMNYTELRGTYHLPTPTAHPAEIKILDKTSAVGTCQDQINEGLASLAKSALKRIIIENPYVVLTEDMRAALKEAGQRGVEIWLGTNSPSSTDSDVTQAFFLEDWPRLLAEIPNLKIFVATGERKLHAKVAVIDDTVTLISTYNLDFLSRHVNSELAAAIWSTNFALETVNGILRDHADPNNKAVEYTILRDPNGVPIRSDGQPVLDAQGNVINAPEVTFGPEQHLSNEMLETYRKKRSKWRWLRNHIPQLWPIRDGSQG